MPDKTPENRPRVTLDDAIDLEYFGQFMPGGADQAGRPLPHLLICAPAWIDQLKRALRLDAVLGVEYIAKPEVLMELSGVVMLTGRIRIKRANLIVVEVHTHQQQALALLALACSRAIAMPSPDSEEGSLPPGVLAGKGGDA